MLIEGDSYDFGGNPDTGLAIAAPGSEKEVVIMDAGTELWRGSIEEYAELLDVVREFLKIVRGNPDG